MLPLTMLRPANNLAGLTALAAAAAPGEEEHAAARREEEEVVVGVEPRGADLRLVEGELALGVLDPSRVDGADVV